MNSYEQYVEEAKKLGECIMPYDEWLAHTSTTFAQFPDNPVEDILYHADRASKLYHLEANPDYAHFRTELHYLVNAEKLRILEILALIKRSTDDD